MIKCNSLSYNLRKFSTHQTEKYIYLCLITVGKFPAPWGGISPRYLENTVSAGHCKTKTSREACES